MKSIFLSSLPILLLLISCGRVVSIERPIDPDGDACHEVVIQTTLSQTEMLLRNEPTRAEKIAHDLRRIDFEGVRVIFYNLNEDRLPQKAIYVFDKNVNCRNGVLSGDDLAENSIVDGSLKIALSGMKVQEGDYKVLIIFNVTDEICHRTEVGATFAELKKPFVNTDLSASISSHFIYYSNADNMISVNKESFFQSENANLLTFSSQIKANHAYVSVDWDPANVPNNHAVSADSIKLAHDVANRKHLMFPEYQTIMLEEGLEQKYPIDANFKGFKDSSLEMLKDDFCYRANGADDVVNHRKINKDLSGSKIAAIPLPENTMDGDEMIARLVTRIVVKIAYTPDVSKIPLGTDWVSFLGDNMTLSEFKKKGKSAKENPNQSEYLQKLASAYDELYNAKGELLHPRGGYSSQLVRLYDNGECWYAIPIRHFTNKQLPTRLSTGRYGVVRNTFYMIKIKGFSAPGAATSKALSLDQDYDREQAINQDLILVTPDIIEYEVML